VYDYSPLDLVGWDGFLWPYAFSILDFEPITIRRKAMVRLIVNNRTYQVDADPNTPLPGVQAGRLAPAQQPTAPGRHEHHITYDPPVTKYLCIQHHEEITIINGQQARKY